MRANRWSVCYRQSGARSRAQQLVVCWHRLPLPISARSNRKSWMGTACVVGTVLSCLQACPASAHRAFRGTCITCLCSELWNSIDIEDCLKRRKLIGIEIRGQSQLMKWHVTAVVESDTDHHLKADYARWHCHRASFKAGSQGSQWSLSIYRTRGISTAVSRTSMDASGGDASQNRHHSLSPIRFRCFPLLITLTSAATDRDWPFQL